MYGVCVYIYILEMLGYAMFMHIIYATFLLALSETEPPKSSTRAAGGHQRGLVFGGPQVSSDQ